MNQPWSFSSSSGFLRPRIGGGALTGGAAGPQPEQASSAPRAARVRGAAL
jgi:hypothetical protein